MSAVVDPTVPSIRVHPSFSVRGDVEQVALRFGDDIVASLTFAAAEATDFSERTGVEASRLSQAAFIGPAVVEPATEGHPLALMVMLALRRQGMAGRTHYVALVDRCDADLVEQLRATPIRGTDGAVHGRIDEAMLRCFKALSEPERDVVRGDGFVEEIRAAVMRGVGDSSRVRSSRRHARGRSPRPSTCTPPRTTTCSHATLRASSVSRTRVRGSGVAGPLRRAPRERSTTSCGSNRTSRTSTPTSTT